MENTMQLKNVSASTCQENTIQLRTADSSTCQRESPSEDKRG